ncbi:hypothetical protein BMW22_38545 (plasmid) [Rhizobium leguminosarum]|uniref:Uncharacterized protein n=1 Tax=Rhizobium leguminosarum TaxID=384 RepID=A0A1L3ZP42_RHILE|nr:hypothetical protein BMW22_38545 [Rhizobium leguminosarum]
MRTAVATSRLRQFDAGAGRLSYRSIISGATFSMSCGPAVIVPPQNSAQSSLFNKRMATR